MVEQDIPPTKPHNKELVFRVMLVALTGVAAVLTLVAVERVVLVRLLQAMVTQVQVVQEELAALGGRKHSTLAVAVVLTEVVEIGLLVALVVADSAATTTLAELEASILVAVVVAVARQAVEEFLGLAALES